MKIKVKLFQNLVIIGLLMIGLKVNCQDADTNIIHWQPTPLLDYNDFTGKPQNGSEVAMTSSGFYFNYQYNGKEDLTLELYATFDKSQSWFKPEGKVPEVLAHEQCHFDITELYVRQMRQQISAYRFKKETDFDKPLTKMYNDCNKKCSQAQRDYDQQTRHGIETEKQLEWQQKIAKELEVLNAFTKEKMEFKVE
jgi:hypothetical protein